MKIQFYILNTDDSDKIAHFTCQLVEKVFNNNHRIQLQLNSTSQVKQYDDALWSYKISESFLAHLPDSEINDFEERVPIILSSNKGFVISQPDILLSLDMTYLPDAQFKQSLFIVDSSNDSVTQARELYRIFTSKNYDLVTHKLTL